MNPRKAFSITARENNMWSGYRTERIDEVLVAVENFLRKDTVEEITINIIDLTNRKTTGQNVQFGTSSYQERKK